MIYHKTTPLSKWIVTICIAALLWTSLNARKAGLVEGNEPSKSVATSTDDESIFQSQVQPLLQKYCVRCHDAENMESGIRVDQLTSMPVDRQLFLWKDIQKQVESGAMPPTDEAQLAADEKSRLIDWITRTMDAARSRPVPKNGSVRRLTVSQYRNTLKDLLGLEEDLTDVLPPDGISKDGFANNGQTMVLFPLQVESYFDIAEKALDLCIVDETARPVIQNFRMDFGAAINPAPCPDALILGANSALLNNADFEVTELKPAKPFAYEPFAMRKSYDFIEGYVGNDTIRGWKKFDSIYHSVFACVRGTAGYPKGEAHQVVEHGLLLRPALPSYPADEILGQPNRYGPMANFKISLRELPEEGNFRVTVKAARYADALLLNEGEAIAAVADSGTTVTAEILNSDPTPLEIQQDGIYQVDIQTVPGTDRSRLSISLDERKFSGHLFEPKPDPAGQVRSTEQSTPFMLVRLAKGIRELAVQFGGGSRLKRVILTRLADDSEASHRFQIFEKRSPSLAVYMGLRRDCGSTLTQVGEPVRVSEGELHEYQFHGAIKDYPSPDVEKDNVNYLAGIREIGVRSEFTDGRDMPRLLVRSVEFEGPFYAEWPPETHRKIFIRSGTGSNPDADAREIIGSFARRAFRRPISPAEDDELFNVWQKSYSVNHNFRQSVKDALVVVLTSPQFLFLIESSNGPEPEDLDAFELASKLSYFLWNAAPDQRLLELASQNVLKDSVDAEIDRMISDPRFGQFIQEFGTQWFSLDKFDVVSIDPRRYPHLTLDIKKHLRQEPIQFLRYLIEQNLPVSNLIQSDFLVANEAVANYYGLASRTESGFQFVPISHQNENLGGMLTQAAILSGLSDGRESNPIKRGAWLARKVIADPPDDPPPNVPQLKEDDASKLTLRERLERHRNQKGCVKCHTGIDPWGIPFESFDASGLLKKSTGVDVQSRLPDGTQVTNLNGLKEYLAHDQIDRVAFSFLKHIASYAAGRSLSYNELQFLQEESLQFKAEGYRMRDLIRFVVKSDLFLKK